MENRPEDTACEKAKQVLARLQDELEARERDLEKARDEENALLTEAAHQSIKELKARIQGVEGEIALLCGED